MVRPSIFGFVGKTFSDFQQSARSVFELTQDSMAASGAVQLSNRARATVLDQWEKLTNVATERDSIESLSWKDTSRSKPKACDQLECTLCMCGS